MSANAKKEEQMSKAKRLMAAAALVVGIAGSTGSIATRAGFSSSPGPQLAKPGCYGTGSACHSRYIARKAGGTNPLEYRSNSGPQSLVVAVAKVRPGMG